MESPVPPLTAVGGYRPNPPDRLCAYQAKAFDSAQWSPSPKNGGPHVFPNISPTNGARTCSLGASSGRTSAVTKRRSAFSAWVRAHANALALRQVSRRLRLGRSIAKRIPLGSALARDCRWQTTTRSAANARPRSNRHRDVSRNMRRLRQLSFQQAVRQ